MGGPARKGGATGRPPLAPRSGRASPRLFGGGGGASVASEGATHTAAGDESSYPVTAAGGRGGGSGDGLLVPLFSEYPGQHLNEPLDLDHFWSAASMFFPEDLPRDVLERIRSSVLPVDAPLGSDSLAALADNPVFRIPRLRQAGGGGGGKAKARAGGGEAESSSDEEDGDGEGSMWGVESAAGEGGHLSDVSYEGEEDLPADAFLGQLRR